ncbi:MAG: hypothetical protein AAF721_18335 [Myxococcota bacterium]
MKHESLTLDRVVEPRRLSGDARERFTTELYGVHRRIFDGVDFESFRSYVVEPKGADTRIQVFRDPAGVAAGYVAIHGFVRTIGGTQTLVVRSEVGVLRPWRGTTPFASFVLRQCLRLTLKHWWRPKVVLGCPVHPSSFFGVTRRAHRSWPRPGRPTPPTIHSTMVELADSFGLRRVPGADALVRQVGWVTRQDEADRLYWGRHRAPEVRFFHAHNPGYTQGEGLTMMVPLGLRLVAVGAIRRLTERVARAWRTSTTRGVAARRRRECMAHKRWAPNPTSPER